MFCRFVGCVSLALKAPTGSGQLSMYCTYCTVLYCITVERFFLRQIRTLSNRKPKANMKLLERWASSGAVLGGPVMPNLPFLGHKWVKIYINTLADSVRHLLSYFFALWATSFVFLVAHGFFSVAHLLKTCCPLKLKGGL